VIEFIALYACDGYSVGDLADAMDDFGPVWCVAEVVEIVSPTAVQVSFIGWPNHNRNININSGHIAPCSPIRQN
jgi:hypothetical protein